MQTCLGIDLGTSNVVVAYINGEQPVAQGWSGTGIGDEYLVPSYVQLRNGQVLIGRPARRAWEKGEPNCYRRFKMNIGRDQGTAPVDAAQLMTHLVENIKNKLLPSETNVTPITEIAAPVITVPHGWSEGQRAATRAAVTRAGIPVARVVSEPIAAAAYYAYARRLEQPETVLVCDMGGGTFDITLTEVYPGQKIQVFEHGTATNECAGTYADALIAAHMLYPDDDPKEKANQLLAAQNQREIARLLLDIEIARRRLNKDVEDSLKAGIKSSDDYVMITIGGENRTQRELTYTEIAEWIRPVCDEAQKLIHALLRRLPEHRPHGVVLAGGMSMMLVVQQAIAQATDVPLERLRRFGDESDRAIAYGAVLIGDGRIKVDEVIPCGIGIVSEDYESPGLEKNKVLIHRDTRAPYSVTSGLYRTKTDKIEALDLKIALGDSSDPRQCEVSTHRLTVKHPLPFGTTYEFVLSVDENLMLTVEARRGDEAKEIIPVKRIERLRG